MSNLEPTHQACTTSVSEAKQLQQISQLRQILISESTPLAKRFRALFSLKHLGTVSQPPSISHPAIDAISAAFTTPSGLLKHELSYCLGQTRSPYAVTTLQSRLDDLNEDPICRHESAEALAAIGNTGAIDSLPILKRYLNDPDRTVRETCEIAIDKLEYEASDTAKQETSDIKPSIYASVDPAPALPASHPHATDITHLKSMMNDCTLPLFTRYRAMFSLRNIGTHEAIDALASGFTDDSALFRHEIAFIFGQMSDPYSQAALTKVLADTGEVGMVRHEAAEALGSIGLPEIDELLKGYVGDEERIVRESAVVALDMSEFEKSGELEYAVIPEVQVGA